MTYARTLEKSVDGDMTKLSLLLDHEMRFCIAGSSNILHARQPTDRPWSAPVIHDLLLVKLVNKCRLHHFGLL